MHSPWTPGLNSWAYLKWSYFIINHFLLITCARIPGILQDHPNVTAWVFQVTKANVDCPRQDIPPLIDIIRALYVIYLQQNGEWIQNDQSICQYEESAHVATGEGETFGQCLTTLRAADWRMLLNFGDDNNLEARMEGWLENMMLEVGLDRNFT